MKLKGTLPCSICKKLVHKRCLKLKGSLTKLTTIMNWTCDVCLHEMFPFHLCTNKQIKDEQKLQQKMDLDIDINKIRKEYNYLYMIKETAENDDTEIDLCKYHVTEMLKKKLTSLYICIGKAR